MKTVKIFIASSIVEFEQERDKLKREMDALPCEHQLKMDFCEDYPDTWTPERTQERYNELVRRCDFFFAIIGAKVGKATLEEIEIAREQFKKSGSAFPKIVVFFKDLPLEELSAEVIALKEEIRGVMGQYPPKFTYVSEITRDILKTLIQYRVFSRPEAFQAIRDEHAAMEGRIKANRQEIALLYEPSHGEITEQNQYKLMVLYRENAELSKKGLFEWGTLYDYASFLHKWRFHLDAIITGTELKALKARYVPADYDDPDDRAALENLLGDCCAALERYEDAERYYRAALDIYRELAEEEPDDYAPDVAETCVKLAEILVITCRHEAAERLYREALTRYLRDWEEYVEEIEYICQAVRGLLKRGREAEAELLRIVTHENLSHWLETFPYPDTAAGMLKQLEANAREVTQDKPDEYERALAEICWYIAKFLYDHNIMEPAEVLAREALENYSKLQNERNIAPSRNLLAQILAKINRPDEAERLYQEAIENFSRLAEQDPAKFAPDLASSYDSLANLLTNTARYGKAQNLYREALEIRQKLAEQDPAKFAPDLASSYDSLANLLTNTARYGKAQNLYREALDIRQKLAEQDPAKFAPDLASSYDSLASLFYKNGRYGEAEDLHREALEIRQKLVEQDPTQFEPDLAMSCNNLANLLRTTGCYEEAEDLFRKALDIYGKLAKQDPAQFEPDLAKLCYNYGLLLKNKCDPVAALAYFDKVVSLLAKYPHFKAKLDTAIRARSKCQQEIWARHGK